jgi:excisionase family DNA binding protein
VSTECRSNAIEMSRKCMFHEIRCLGRISHMKTSYEVNMTNRLQVGTTFGLSPERARVLGRHSWMIQRARGFVTYRKRRGGLLGARGQVGEQPGNRQWMRSRQLCRYLGCSLRHLYWLIRHRGFPFYVLRSRRGPRYVFWRPHVDAWLRRYAKKGRRLSPWNCFGAYDRPVGR